MMKQYSEIKAKHNDCLLLYRMGDFFELFFKDAEIASRVLGLTLTSRNHGGKDKTPLAGFPHHALDRYITRLIQAGHKVAICEQIEDPKLAQGVVKRGVVEIVTAGTTTDEKYLDDKSNNYLVSVYKNEVEVGLSQVDISTGEFRVTQFPLEKLESELERIDPAELVLPEQSRQDGLAQNIKSNFDRLIITHVDDFNFSYEQAYQLLTKQMRTASLEGFGCENMQYGIAAAGAALNYLIENKKNALSHVNRIATYDINDFVTLDFTTQRSLEIFSTMHAGEKEGSLLQVLDKTHTAMGGRLLKNWIKQPLLDLAKIQARLDAVEELTDNALLREGITTNLKAVYDIERLAARIGYEKINGRDMLSLKQSLELLPGLKRCLGTVRRPLLKKIAQGLIDFSPLTKKIGEAVVDNPPLTISAGDLIRAGFDRELDTLKQENLSGKQWMASLQELERKRTGISTLKVHFNKVFGYYIEVSKTNKDKVPSHYIRKQTLVNAERYITPDMKEKETKVLSADEKIKNLEHAIFLKLRAWVAGYCEKIQAVSAILARLDVVTSFAQVALDNRYCKPEMNNGTAINVSEGRHPVVEQLLSREEFVPNDFLLNNEEDQVLLITGPNMAGKSTFIRQVGLTVLLAQIGSFVPADKAVIGLVDRIFTRVGASDRLAKGQSTFLVEMNEMANILNNATARSLLLLDEIGRGTSTFDGLSIAWAITEYLHNHASVAAKTLFATHYHELTELEQLLPRVKNYNVSVKEWNDEIIFLRKIVRGSCDHSYGIQAARLAGMPAQVITRAKAILRQLETEATDTKHLHKMAGKQQADQPLPDSQINLFQPPPPSPAIDALRQLNTNSLTPLQALNELSRLKEIVEKEPE